MAVASWSRQFTITSSLGTLVIDPTLLDPAQCSAGAGLRVTTDDVPSGDGAIFHPRFKSGYQMHVGLQLLSSGAIAVDSTLQTLYDLLMSHLEAMIDTDGRIQWQIAGGGNDRMLDAIRTLEMPGPAGGLPKQFAFAVESPFPYALDAPQTTTTLVAATPVTVTRVGSAKKFWPVAKVNGPVTAFTLENLTSGEQLQYNGALPGASAIASGHYAEIDFFKKTVTLDGNVSFLEEGVVWSGAKFWALNLGANSIKLTGAGGQLLWNEAWA